MNQERIKDRILRRAARLWGYSELEAETSFDPVVSLLLSATASELEKLGFELESSRSRIIERILEIMFPEEVSGVVPSRSLIQVFPVENQAKVSLKNHFKTSKRIHNVFNPAQSGSKDIFFSPTLEAKVTTAKVEFLAFGNTLNHVESYFFTDVLAKSEQHIPSGEMWVGIRCSNKIDLENLMLYIDINNTYQKELFFYYLRQAKIYFGDKELSLHEGYNVEQENINLENIITKNYSDLEHIYTDVNEFYFSNFFTIKEKISHIEKSNNEKLFENYFKGNRLSEEDDIIWLKFKFSEAVVSEVLENVSVTLNCIPVVNVYNATSYHRVTGRLNIIPIKSDDFFLDLDYVADNSGKRFDLKNYAAESNGTSAVLRKGGVSRFDQRGASELLQYLLELIKDETAAFSGIGGDSATETLRQINQNVAALHQLAKEKSFAQANNPYLVITSDSQNSETVCNISYWLTHAEEGNDIKPATTLTVEGSDSAILDKTAVMMKPSAGGRKSLSPQDKILEYRNSLLTRGRIVTVADIRIFGLNHFKNTIKDIEVSKGTKKEVSLKGGFSRTIDVFLIRNTDLKETIKDSEWEYLCESFLLKLKKASANIYPYRIFEK
ncbi:type VI secretion system baseplate subunit TssF [Chryseobacterium wangxinyae]|uniref:type VI secretion system baseplate subunit TssF n=1 Tax=Chryseobacterium sp. CY350 TaxID=2997336 RepID=UPI00226E5CF2|nr:type VI secretion system baseplate subunit TssF [Chryseobacterium sp. CY350]MCY0977825.1 type VI secretion system baseplate subunit TssF [Chryseobacterium sp. CY350]WBZ94913.1 type VI secretion system baseplate subunit TssF [Chryseobacterium sp. CY350]